MAALGALFSALLYLLVATPALGAGEVAYVQWPTGPVLDQRDTPQCVGYSLETWLEAGPYAYQSRQIPSAYWIYAAGQQRDGWNDVPHDGTSVRAAMAYLQEVGYVDSVAYTHDVEQLATYVLNNGPAEMSTMWTTSMDMLDATGVITPNAFVRGYHAWVIDGYDRVTEMFDAQNTWGKYWGIGGHFKISKDSVFVLLANDLGSENREAAMPHKDAVKWLQKQLGN